MYFLLFTDEVSFIYIMLINALTINVLLFHCKELISNNIQLNESIGRKPNEMSN